MHLKTSKGKKVTYWLVCTFGPFVLFVVFVLFVLGKSFCKKNKNV